MSVVGALVPLGVMVYELGLGLGSFWAGAAVERKVDGPEGPQFLGVVAGMGTQTAIFLVGNGILFGISALVLVAKYGSLANGVHAVIDNGADAMFFDDNEVNMSGWGGLATRGSATRDFWELEDDTNF